LILNPTILIKIIFNNNLNLQIKIMDNIYTAYE